MSANPFKAMFARLFDSREAGAVVLDERQRRLLDRAVAFVVDNTDPRIRLVPRYKKKLTPALIRTGQYLGGIIRALPEPLELSRDAWATDPRINAFFATADDVPQVLGRSAELRGFFDDPRHIGAREAHALLVMEKREQKVLGIALEDGVLKRDVAQVNVSFTAHRIVVPTATPGEVLVEFGLRGVRRLLDIVLARIAAIQERATELEERKAFLATRLRLLKSTGFGIEPVADRTREIAEIESQLAHAAGELMEKKVNSRSMEHYLEQINDVLWAPEQHLTVSEVRLRVNRLGIKIAENSPEDAHSLVLTELRLGSELCAIVAPVKCKRSDLPPAGQMLAEAAKYLL